MLTRLKIKRGEGNLVSAQTNPQPRRVREPPPRALEETSSMSSREGEAPEEMDPKEEEWVFWKAFLDMTEVVRILYQERNDRIVGEGSKNLPPNIINDLPALRQTFINKWELKRNPLQRNIVYVSDRKSVV